MLIVDTVVDVGVGTGAFVGLVAAVDEANTLIHMDGRVKAGSRVIISCLNYRVSATAKSCANLGDSYAIWFVLDCGGALLDGYEWPKHIKALAAVA